MRGYRANDWVTVSSAISFSITEKHYIELWLVGTETVSVHGLHQDKKTPPALLASGTSFRFKKALTGFREVKVTSASPFSYQVSQAPLQNGDPLNDDDPPAPPLPGSNLLAQMRALFANEFARNRPVMLDPDELPFADRYLVEDDDQDFEEEIHAKRVAAAKAKQEEAKRKAEPAQPAPQQAGAGQAQPPSQPASPPQGGSQSPAPRPPSEAPSGASAGLS